MNDIIQMVLGGSLSRRSAVGDVETGMQQDAFLQEIEALTNMITEIGQQQIKMKDLYERGKTLIKSHDIQRNKNELQDIVIGVCKLGGEVKRRLDALENGNETSAHRRATGFENERRRTALIVATRKKLKDQMAKFSGLRSQIQEDYRHIVERRVYAVTGNRVSQEEIDRMIDSGESETIFRKAILSQGRPAVMATITEIQERHQTMKELEKGLLELHQLFLDLAVLVEEQGHKVDDIENNVTRATSFVDRGVTEVVKAKNDFKRTNKCKWLLAVIVLIILIIVAVVLWLQFGNNGKQ